MKESAVSEKKAGSVSAQRAKKAASLTMDGLGVADQPLMSIVQRAGCRDCGPSAQSIAGGIMQTPMAQRQAAAMSLQRARGNRFVQRMAVQAKHEPNRTGMPDRLKAGIESLSGIDMSDVRVHANSELPAGLGALAYTQGNKIYLGPGQESHLPHEAWHVVQQKQGQVRPTMKVGIGIAVNDDVRLETEAERMGRAACQSSPSPAHKSQVQQVDYSKLQHNGFIDSVTQLYLPMGMNAANTDIEMNKPNKVYKFTHNTKIYWIKIENRDEADQSLKAQNVIGDIAGTRNKKWFKGWNIVTPVVRIADANDLLIIRNLLPGLGALVDQDIIISEDAEGASAEVPHDLEAYEMHNQPADKSEKERRRKSFESIFPIWSDKSYIKALGYIAVVDLLIGNFDRINRNLNLKNLFIEPRTKTITLIDNIEGGQSLEDFANWSHNQFVSDFRGSQWHTLADKFVEFNEGNYQARSIISRIDSFKEGIKEAYEDLEKLNKENPPHAYKHGDEPFNAKIRQRVTYLM